MSLTVRDVCPGVCASAPEAVMSPCYQSEITVSGSGKICRHGDKPVSCWPHCGDPRGRMTLFSESHGVVYPFIPVTRGR